MQIELDGETHLRPIVLHGINQIGAASANPTVCSGRDLPWLQDEPGEAVWDAWDVTYRDVIILDEANVVIDVFNLTSHDLQDPVNQADLKARLVAAADATP